jgi:hypothetical protein
VKRGFITLAFALAALGCDNDLPLASQIQHMRVLGASTSVMGDPARTTPKPGEKAKLSWSMVYPDTMVDDSGLRSIFFVCTAPTEYTGTPICQELLDIAKGGSISDIVADAMGKDAPDCEANPNRTYKLGPFTIVCVSGTPQLDVAIDKDTKATARLVRGTICRNGMPQLDQKDPTGMSCKPLPETKVSEQENIAVYGTVPIEYNDEDRNHTPSIDALTLAFHDPPLAWDETFEEPTPINDDNCADESKDRHVMHSDGFIELVTLMYDDAQREVHDGEREALEFSGYTTFGKLSRRFTVFASDAEAPLRSTFNWDLKPEERDTLNGKSKHVRFYFTILDHRGGFAITTRDLCIDR